MKHRFSGSHITTIVLSLAVMAGLFGIIGVEALAQGSSPTQTPYPTSTPYPTNTAYPTQTPYPRPGAAAAQATEAIPNGGDAEWTVSDLTFENRYPNGFTFSVKITSSAGPLTRGRVVWTHAPGTQRSRPAEIDAETGVLTAAWDATGSDAIPPWLGVTYTWDVTDAAGNAYQTDPQVVEYADTSREWKRTEGEDVIVFTEGLPDDLGPMTVDAMAQQRETYRAAWGGLLPYKPRAILFGDQEAWLEWQLTVTDSHVVGTTRSDWGATVQVVAGGNLRDLAYGSVLHEVAHLYQSEFTLMAPATWFDEGNATFFELSQQYDYEAHVRQAAANGELLALLQDTGPGVRGRQARLGYDIGYTFWKWLADNYGLEGHRKLIELLKNGVERNQAIEEVTGLSVDEVESRWRVWLGASAVVPTLIPVPTMFTFPTVTPFVFPTQKP